MPPSSVAARSLALALLGLGAASAMAQSPTVTAFNPYNGMGLAGSAPPPASYPSPSYNEAPPPTGGMAFNPWRPAGVAAMGPSTVMAGGGPPPGAMPGYSYSRGANLPSPPPGPIESRLMAIPELGSRGGAPRIAATAAPEPIVPPAPPPPAQTAAAAPAPPPTPEPVPIKRTPPATVVVPPPASAPPKTVAEATPPPPPAPEPAPMPRPAPAAAMATLEFSSQSAEINAAARAELERVAKTLGNTRQIELRAFAGGPDPNDARKVALARALAVRSYLIDLGVKARIEVAAYAGASERVDVVTPGT